MSELKTCCICMEDIVSITTNSVVTECGHLFHTSCLMKNVVINGFKCPYCRTIMANENDSENLEINNHAENLEIVDDEEKLSVILFEGKWYISSSKHVIYDYNAFTYKRKQIIVGIWQDDNIEIFEEYKK